MKNILLPTDFSENAWNAIKYAISMYADEECNFTLLNTYYATPPAHDVIVSNYWDTFEKDSKFGLDKTLKRIEDKLDLKGSNCKQITRYGMIGGTIGTIADEENIDLIVMGTKGASGIKEVLMGSNTARVINNVNVPIIAVPARSVYQVPSSILLATDYKELENIEVLKPLKEIATKFDSELLILNILKNERKMVGIDEAMEGFALHGYFEPLKHSYDVSNNDNPEDGINEFASKYAVHMIAMVKRDHPFFESIFSHSVSKKLAFHTDVPLLVMHE